MNPRILALTTFLISSLGQIPLNASSQYNVIDLGIPEGVPQWESSARALNNAGQIVGYGAEPSSGLPLPPNAFFWTESDGMQNLGQLAGYSTSNANDINQNGRVVGDGDHPFLWDSANGFFEPDLGPGFNTANAINDLNQIVGRAQGQAYIWDQSIGKIHLGDLGGSGSVANALNNAGQVVGGAFIPGPPEIHAFVITPDNGAWYRDDDANGINDLMTDLAGLPGLPASQAYDINENGSIIGAAYSLDVDNIHACLWRQGNTLDLGTLGGDASLAYAINQHDHVVGTADDQHGNARPFLWKNGLMRDVNDLLTPGANWQINALFDINDHGWIVGTATQAGSDHRHAVLLIPEPATLFTLLLISYAVIPNARRKTH